MVAALDLDDATLEALAERLAPRVCGRCDTATRPQLMTPHEAATRAGVHVETIRRAVRDGRLPAGRVGRAVRIAADDLNEWLSAPAGRRARREHQGRTNRRPMADAMTKAR